MQEKDVTNKLTVIVALAISLWSLPAHAHEGAPHVMGTVATVDANYIVVQTREGKTLSLSIDTNTKFRQGDKAAAATDLKAGDRVVAEVTRQGDSLTASEIRLATPAKDKGAKGQEEHHSH